MSFGPIELLIIKFPGSQFTGEITPALTELVESKTVRIIDLMLVHKDADGTVTVHEINDVGDDEFAVFDAALPEQLTCLLTEEDAQAIGELLEPDASAGMLLFENTWATRFAQAVRSASGEVLINERIPRAVIEELVATAAV